MLQPLAGTILRVLRSRSVPIRLIEFLPLANGERLQLLDAAHELRDNGHARLLKLGPTRRSTDLLQRLDLFIEATA